MTDRRVGFNGEHDLPHIRQTALIIVAGFLLLFVLTASF